MRRIRATYIASIGLCAILGSGQTSRVLESSRVEITLPPSVASERLFVRYVLSGQDLGGAIYGPANVASFGISTLADGHPADSMKAILYAPGCEIQTLDLKLTGSDSTRYSFICQRVPDLEIHGILARSDRLWRHKVRLQANYIAGWAESFLGLSDTLITSIPVGDPTDLSADGRFRLLLPDYSQNPGRSGEFRIVAKDQTNEAVVAMLVPPKSVRTRMGGLVVRRDYADELILRRVLRVPLESTTTKVSPSDPTSAILAIPFDCAFKDKDKGIPFVKRGYRVRLNGAGQQWGKDPPKEVVG